MFTRDIYGKDILLKGTQQVMMAWEKPYMDALIARLQITGDHDVLEIGFGLGYSARAIQSYKPTSHTVIEIDESVIARVKTLDWAQDITVQKGAWQDLLKDDFGSPALLGVYDRVFFDDFPLTGVEDSLYRLVNFNNRVLQFHCKPGAKVSFYLENSLTDMIAPSQIYTYDEQEISVRVPENCNYVASGVTTMYLPLFELTACQDQKDQKDRRRERT